tara:strand:+ start:54 stop:656 length:603 start_codon:yes stop_codon:yes gene_type:complete
MTENKQKEEKTAEKEANQNTNDTSNNENHFKKDESVEKKLKESEDKLLRSLAEIENQRRRFEKEIKDAFEFGSFNFAKESLAILDNLQRAKEAIKSDKILKENKDLDKFLENINIIEKDLLKIFEKNNIKKIDVNGKKFDPNLHQAMIEVEDNSADVGTVVQEIQSGYTFSERLLRPALVGVSKKKNDKNQAKDEKKDEK